MDTPGTDMDHPSNVKAIKYGHNESIRVLGFDLTGMKSDRQFAILGVGHIVTACLFALLQEQVYTVEDEDGTKFKFQGLITVCTTLTFTLCAAFERARKGDDQRPKAPMLSYLKLSILTLGGMYFTNWSLNFLNYATRIMFKASKVVPVMIVSVFMQGKKYSAMEYFDAALLVTGISIFVMADSAVSPDFNIVGILLISVGVGCDAITSNYEERHFFKELGCTHQEVIQYSSGIGSIIGILTILVTGEANVALPFAIKHPEAIAYCCGAALMGYLSVGFILLLVKHFSATMAEVVKSCRKVFSIILSYTVHSKPYGGGHLVGGAVFVSAVALGVRIKKGKQQEKNRKGSELPLAN